MLIDRGSNFVTVMTGPTVPTSGVYYLSASLTLEIGAGDVAGCAFAPESSEGTLEQIGPSLATPSRAWR